MPINAENLLDYGFSNLVDSSLLAALAQLVEQRTENPCVPGSIPGGGTLKAPEKGAFVVYDGSIILSYNLELYTGLDFCVTFQASKLYRAIEKYRTLNSDSVVDYRKVLTQMDKLTEESPDGSINDASGSLNGRINEADGRLTRFLADKKTAETSEEDSVYFRKVRILSELKGKPQSTIEQLVSALNIPERTLYRDIEWLRENGYLERLGSKKSGSWHVIKELQ